MLDDGAPVHLGNGWYRYEDDAAAHYYYNTISEVTQWDAPTAEQCAEPEWDHDDGGAAGEGAGQGTVGETDTLTAYFTQEPAEADDAGVPTSRREPSTAGASAAAATPTAAMASTLGARQQTAATAGTTHQPQVEAGGVLHGLGSPEGGSSQFAEAMAMLRSHPDIFGEQRASEGNARERGVATGVTRADSQYMRSLNALKSQGVDSMIPVASPEDSVPRRSTGNKWTAQTAAAATANNDDHSFLSADLAGLSEAAEEEDEDIQRGLSDGPGTPPGLRSSEDKWVTAPFQAVVFVWYETDGVSKTEPLFPSADGNLQVGPILVAWDGLSVQGPKGLGYITIPYENIVMWTLHLEETCLDLTLDGTFTDDPERPGQRAIQWWTGQVLELRCCLSTANATVQLGNTIKEVCTLKAKHTSAAELNRSAIAAAAATLSHKVSTTTPTQRRATLARKLAPAAAEDEPSPVPMAALTKTSPPKEKKARGLANLFARKVTIK